MPNHSEKKPDEFNAQNNAGNMPATPTDGTGIEGADIAAADIGNEETSGTEKLAEQLSAAQNEIAKLKDAYARSIADLDNYRRRVVREKEELRKFATQSVLEDLLPVLDNIRHGLASADKHPEAKPVADGFKMISDQLKSTLEQHGLKEINPLGEAFDAHSHEAVSQVPHPEIPDHNIVEVLRTGYRLHDRLVRPASVVVSAGPAK